MASAPQSAQAARVRLSRVAVLKVILPSYTKDSVAQFGSVPENLTPRCATAILSLGAYSMTPGSRGCQTNWAGLHVQLAISPYSAWESKFTAIVARIAGAQWRFTGLMGLGRYQEVWTQPIQPGPSLALRALLHHYATMSTAPLISMLDLVPINEGGTIGQALANAADLAAHAQALGYHRYWVAEHHGMAGIGGAATSVVLAHVGAHTQTIRIGAGGIMLPNHAPLQIAEQFGTLDALYPGRIDLGLGRAPGSDGRVAASLRHGDPEAFPRQVVELQAFFAGDPRMGFTAVPGAGAEPEIWVLGSSTYGAQLAAALGLPYGFASHFAPGMLDEALAIYRQMFRPSAVLDRPRVMVGFNVFAADTADEARFHATSMQQGFIALRTGQTSGRFRPPVAGYYESLAVGERAILDQMLAYTAIGTVDDVTAALATLLRRTQADEVIIGSQIFDHTARRRSFAIAAEAMAAVATGL